MENKNKTDLIRKVRDYCMFGLGLSGIIDGTIRIANNPPEHLLNLHNLGNGQLQMGYLSTAVGGAVLAYGIERIVKYCKK